MCGQPPIACAKLSSMSLLLAFKRHVSWICVLGPEQLGSKHCRVELHTQRSSIARARFVASSKPISIYVESLKIKLKSITRKHVTFCGRHYRGSWVPGKSSSLTLLTKTIISA